MISGSSCRSYYLHSCQCEVRPSLLQSSFIEEVVLQWKKVISWYYVVETWQGQPWSDFVIHGSFTALWIGELAPHQEP